MAKSKLEKLKDAIEAARAFLLLIVIGIEVGQYHQSDVDEFTSIVDAAELVADNNELEPAEYDNESVVVNEALVVIQGKVIIEQVATTKVVKFKGTASQCTGSHTLHYKQSVVSFKDGKAELPLKLADELIEAGYVE
ncbi:MAG TPA: hypothetical protein IAA29_07490 [Candidatus Paenibacillus intestinavium]|nr:hypothetical protein [Candidatus Paenibacillus intestinavium]